MGTVLIYNLSPQKAAKLQMLCRRLNLSSVCVKKEDFGYRLAYLLGLSEDAEKLPGDDFDGEMIYLSGIYGGMLQLLLDQMRRNKIIVPLKAIRTETNLGFSSYELYRELSAEREAIAQGMRRHETDQDT